MADDATKWALWVVAGIIALSTITHCNSDSVPDRFDDCVVEYWATGPACV